MKKIITVARNRNEIFKQQQLTIGEHEESY